MSTGTGRWWECNDIRTAAAPTVLKPWTSNEQETAGTSRKAPHGGARPRHEGAGVLRRILQRDATVFGRRSLLLFVSYGRSGYRCNGAGKAVPVRVA